MSAVFKLLAQLELTARKKKPRFSAKHYYDQMQKYLDQAQTYYKQGDKQAGDQYYAMHKSAKSNYYRKMGKNAAKIKLAASLFLHELSPIEQHHQKLADKHLEKSIAIDEENKKHPPSPVEDEAANMHFAAYNAHVEARKAHSNKKSWADMASKHADHFTARIADEYKYSKRLLLPTASADLAQDYYDKLKSAFKANGSKNYHERKAYEHYQKSKDKTITEGMRKAHKYMADRHSTFARNK